jgi:molybdopterin-synthase adenylyltransferase
MNDAQLQRFARHVLLDGVGLAGQQRWLYSHVLVVGAGGLGSSALLHLAAAGVGTVTVMDPDHVELTNLQRQIAHSTERLGWTKVASAQAAMQALHPGTQVNALAQRADADSLPARVAAADVVLDCSDNYATRQAVNAACVAAGKPLVWAAAVTWHAQASVWLPGQDLPCYACVFPPEAPATDADCALMGVLGPLVGLVGSLQAAEALKVLAGLPTLAGRLWMWDARSSTAETLALQRQPHCPVCGK